jgi:hypothetical protein
MKATGSAGGLLEVKVNAWCPPAEPVAFIKGRCFAALTQLLTLTCTAITGCCS